MSSIGFLSVLPSSSESRTVFHLLEKELQEVEANMRPGAYSEIGFLSYQDRLMQVCVHDLTTLSKLGVSCDQIGKSLQQLVDKARQAAHGDVEAIVDRKFKVRFGLITSGYQECPFGPLEKPCHTGAGVFTIQNMNTEESLSVTPLGIRLIEDHAFFQGNVGCRIDPETVCRVLELGSGAGLKKARVEEKLWEFVSFDLIGEEYEDAAKQHAKKIQRIDEFATAYLGIHTEDVEDLMPKNKQGYLQASDQQGIFEFSDSDEFIIPVSSGRKREEPSAHYCHIFNHRRRMGKFHPVVDGVAVSWVVESGFIGVCVFKLHAG
jgi:hypothetical protein